MRILKVRKIPGLYVMDGDNDIWVHIGKGRFILDDKNIACDYDKIPIGEIHQRWGVRAISWEKPTRAHR